MTEKEFQIPTAPSISDEGSDINESAQFYGRVIESLAELPPASHMIVWSLISAILMLSPAIVLGAILRVTPSAPLAVSDFTLLAVATGISLYISYISCPVTSFARAYSAVSSINRSALDLKNGSNLSKSLGLGLVFICCLTGLGFKRIVFSERHTSFASTIPSVTAISVVRDVVPTLGAQPQPAVPIKSDDPTISPLASLFLAWFTADLNVACQISNEHHWINSISETKDGTLILRWNSLALSSSQRACASSHFEKGGWVTAPNSPEQESP